MTGDAAFNEAVKQYPMYLFNDQEVLSDRSNWKVSHKARGCRCTTSSGRASPHEACPVRSARRLYNAFLVPGNTILLLLFVVPLGAVVLFSFGTTNVVGLPEVGFTWTNYSEVLQSYYVPVLLRTVLFAAAATVICLALGYPLAYFATRFAKRWAPLIVAAIVLTWLVDYLVRIYAWTALLDDNGLINGLLKDLGFGPVHMLGTNGAVIVGLVYVYFPLMVLPLYAALGQLNPSLIEAGKDLYGSPPSDLLARHVARHASRSRRRRGAGVPTGARRLRHCSVPRRPAVGHDRQPDQRAVHQLRIGHIWLGAHRRAAHHAARRVALDGALRAAEPDGGDNRSCDMSRLTISEERR